MRAPCVYVASTSDLHSPGKLTREEGPRSSLLHGVRASEPPDVVHVGMFQLTGHYGGGEGGRRRRRWRRKIKEGLVAQGCNRIDDSGQKGIELN